MAKTKSNEWNFAANVGAEMSRLLALPEFEASTLGRVEAERTLSMGRKRPDLVFFDRSDHERAVVTGELKAPWTKEGKTPFDSDLVVAAHSKAVQVGARYFVTWNIKRVVVWKTDDDGVALFDRVVYDRELISTALLSGEDLTTTSFRQTFEKGIRDFLVDLVAILDGRLGMSYLPLDRLFVLRLESMLDHVDDKLQIALSSRMAKSKRFAVKIEQWMRTQSWVVSDHTHQENVERAVRFCSYVLLNRLCFYNALRRKYPSLAPLRISRATRTGDQLRARLGEFFERARTATGDYQTVFEESDADAIPFLSDDCVEEWREIVSSLDKYDFAKLDIEVIGAMYEQLIRPEERHRFGQHYTQPAIVDLINAFSIRDSTDVVLDPACGGGTFLVRAYSRKRFLNPSLAHNELLDALYGCDILSYACHLSVINLAVRDLIDDDNFPQIHLGDYMDVKPDVPFCSHPIAMSVGGLPVEEKVVVLEDNVVDAIVGNPPYINARLIPAERRKRYLGEFETEYKDYRWDTGSDILVWFWVHSLRFLKPGGRLSLITQAAWIDVEYGFPLQEWIFDHFRIVAVMESETEPWFTDARVATVVVILEEESDDDARRDNIVRFIQFRRALKDIILGLDDAARHGVSNKLRDRILTHNSNTSTEDYRIRLVVQDALEREGEDDAGQYQGGNWGRHLRALDCVYELQARQRDAFCPLATLADIERGTTTNCDDFFIVSDVSSQETDRYPKHNEFKSVYGVSRVDVETGNMRVIERADGRRFVFPSDNLSPILKTARDVFERLTSRIENEHYAVVITKDRSNLTTFEMKYVRGGEKEEWHLRPSFVERSDWYKLRDVTPADIYFVKTIQYAPQLLWNDSGVLPNQRLYRVLPKPGIDSELLAAAMSSTFFAAERFTGAKALGREAANDIEVFTARKMLTFDTRRLTSRDSRSMRDAFRRLRERPVGPILEAPLVEGGLAAAQAYINSTPMSPKVLPKELLDSDRRVIDRIIALALGIGEHKVDAVLCELYVSLTAYQRKARLLELHAQVNRRGSASDRGITPQSLGDEIIGELIEDGFRLQTIPNEFVPNDEPDQAISLPISGKPALVDGELFADGTFAITFGRHVHVTFTSEACRALAFTLAQAGIRGDIRIPKADAIANEVNRTITSYMSDLRNRIEDKAKRISDDEDFRNRVVDAAFKFAVRRHTDDG